MWYSVFLPGKFHGQRSLAGAARVGHDIACTRHLHPPLTPIVPCPFAFECLSSSVFGGQIELPPGESDFTQCEVTAQAEGYSL